MTYWTICPHRVQRKSSWNTNRDSKMEDVKASVFCGVPARSGHFLIFECLPCFVVCLHVLDIFSFLSV